MKDDKSKYDKAWFDFSIEPEDSKFLEEWNKLRKSKKFKKDIKELKKEIKSK